MNNKKVISAVLLVSDGPVEHEYFQNLLELNKEELEVKMVKKRDGFNKMNLVGLLILLLKFDLVN